MLSVVISPRRDDRHRISASPWSAECSSHGEDSPYNFRARLHTYHKQTPQRLASRHGVVNMRRYNNVTTSRGESISQLTFVILAVARAHRTLGTSPGRITSMTQRWCPRTTLSVEWRWRPTAMRVRYRGAAEACGGALGCHSRASARCFGLMLRLGQIVVDPRASYLVRGHDKYLSRALELPALGLFGLVSVVQRAIPRIGELGSGRVTPWWRRPMVRRRGQGWVTYQRCAWPRCYLTGRGGRKKKEEEGNTLPMSNSFEKLNPKIR